MMSGPQLSIQHVIGVEQQALFQRRLLTWYRTGRRRLAWRKRRAAYATLIAEVLLRKTDAGKVALVYEPFLKRYPAPRDLANADEGELRVALRILGIADRARLLKEWGSGW